MAKKIRKPALRVKEKKKEIEKEETWYEFIYGSSVRYWYLFGCLVADAFAPLEVLRHKEWGLRYEIAGIIFFALLLIEIWGYLRLWGKDGRWNFDDDE